MLAATFFDGEGWRDAVLDTTDERPTLRDAWTTPGMPRLDGVLVGGFTDHHVHLQLVDHEDLAASALGRVVDLGADPSAIAALASAGGVVVEYAGAFLTPVGGYPSDRDWAPDGSFRGIVDAADVERAVREMADAGASCIKVASNSSAGPVFDDALLGTIVGAAHALGLPVVAHAEGRGEAQRVARLGADLLAHAPFTERLTDAEIAEQAASVSWISTLAIHGGADLHVALDNVRRFHAAGGTVLYGTDMGNGPTPVGLNPQELAALRDAGVTGVDLLRALAPHDPREPRSRLLLLPGVDADPALARPLTRADLKA